MPEEPRSQKLRGWFSGFSLLYLPDSVHKSSGRSVHNGVGSVYKGAGRSVHKEELSSQDRGVLLLIADSASNNELLKNFLK